MMSSKKPGRNRSILSCVAAHNDTCRSSRVSSGEVGGTSSPVAFITSRTFFRDSGTASYCNRESEYHTSEEGILETHQLVTTIDVHQPVEQIQHLDPQNPNVGRLTLACFELHERLAEERGCSKASLGQAEGVAHERLRLQQLIQQREQDAVEDVFDLAVAVLVYWEMRAKEDALQVDQCGVSEFARCVRGLAG